MSIGALHGMGIVKLADLSTKLCMTLQAHLQQLRIRCKHMHALATDRLSFLQPSFLVGLSASANAHRLHAARHYGMSIALPAQGAAMLLPHL